MSKAVSRPANQNTWRELIEPAFRIIDSLEASGYGKLDYRLGGGTVLMFRFDHRISKDIDIFTHDAQALSFLSPRLNATAEREAAEYQEEANLLKLVLPAGDIDFIVAAPVIPEARPVMTMVAGRMVALEATSEILAKKLAYRADSFKVRDVFDMASALVLDQSSAMAALAATRRTRPALLAALQRLGAVSMLDHSRDLLMTQTGQLYATDMRDRLIKAVADVDGRTAG